MGRSCANCDHFWHMPEALVNPICRRYPPDHALGWPETSEKGRCGEWTARQDDLPRKVTAAEVFAEMAAERRRDQRRSAAPESATLPWQLPELAQARSDALADYVARHPVMQEDTGEQPPSPPSSDSISYDDAPPPAYSPYDDPLL
jgi:hypothetical protein